MSEDDKRDIRVLIIIVLSIGCVIFVIAMMDRYMRNNPPFVESEHEYPSNVAYTEAYEVLEYNIDNIGKGTFSYNVCYKNANGEREYEAFGNWRIEYTKNEKATVEVRHYEYGEHKWEKTVFLLPNT